MTIHEDIKKAVVDAIDAQGWPAVDFVIEHPTDVAHGDYACNVAMVLAKKVGKAPRVVAEQLCVALENILPAVASISVAGPGFLNFHLSRVFFASSLSAIAAETKTWGNSTIAKGEVVLFEYTSPNLFKPLHVGNLVGNITGEVLARLFVAAGADVRRCNYPSDIGPVVAKGVWGLKNYGLDPKDIAALGEAYRLGTEAYENSADAKIAIDAINKALYENSDPTLTALRTAGIATSLVHLRELCRQLGTEFDTEIMESEASPLGTSIVRQHVGTVFTESEGAVVYVGEKVGLHTRVFLNSKGLPTYEAKDLGNFSLKQQAHPDWTRSIVVTGSEQREYFKVLYAALREVFPAVASKSLEHIATGFLTLTTGKMSSRKGNVLTGESVLMELKDAAREKAADTRTDDVTTLTEQVAVAALKYQVLRQGLGSDIVFDKEKALSFEGDSGPYLQYTHARACSVGEKARAAGIVASVEMIPSAPYPIEHFLYRFPEVTIEALVERAPQKLVTYLTEIAGMFNSFYASEAIADSADQYAPYKLALTDAVRITLHNGIELMGATAPEKM